MPYDDFDGMGLDCCGPLADFIQSRIESGDTDTDVASAIHDFEASLAYLESLDPDTPLCLIDLTGAGFGAELEAGFQKRQAELRKQIAAEQEAIAARAKQPKRKAKPVEWDGLPEFLKSPKYLAAVERGASPAHLATLRSNAKRVAEIAKPMRKAPTRKVLTLSQIVAGKTHADIDKAKPVKCSRKAS